MQDNPTSQDALVSNPQTEMSTQAAFQHNSLLSSDLVEASESVSTEASLQANTSSTEALRNLSELTELTPDSNLSVLRQESRSNLAELSKESKLNLAALLAGGGSNLIEANSDNIFLETCKQAFQKQQAGQISTKDNQASPAEASLGSHSNLPIMYENDFEIAPVETIRANCSTDFFADYDREKETPFSAWVWYRPKLKSTYKPISLETFKQGLIKACGNNEIQQPQVIFKMKQPLHTTSIIKQPLHNVSIQNTTSVSVRVGAMGFSLERTLSENFVNESQDLLNICNESNYHDIVVPLSEIKDGKIANDLRDLFSETSPQPFKNSDTNDLSSKGFLVLPTGAIPGAGKTPPKTPPSASRPVQVSNRESNQVVSRVRQRQSARQNRPAPSAARTSGSNQQPNQRLTADQPVVPTSTTSESSVSDSSNKADLELQKKIKRKLIEKFKPEKVKEQKVIDLLKTGKRVNSTDLASLRKNLKKRLQNELDILDEDLEKALNVGRYLCTKAEQIKKGNIEFLRTQYHATLRIERTQMMKTANDIRTLAGRVGNFLNLKQVQHEFSKIRENLNYPYDPNKLEIDHVELKEFREIMDIDQENTTNRCKAILIKAFLNNIRTLSTICTREKSYLELNNSLLEARSELILATLNNDSFKYFLIKNYQLETAQNIAVTHFVVNRFCVEMALNIEWRNIPKDISLAFYELIVGYHRLVGGLQERINRMDPVSNAEIPKFLNERLNAVTRLTNLMDEFKVLLQSRNPLTDDQRNAMIKIISRYTSAGQTAIEFLKFELNINQDILENEKKQKKAKLKNIIVLTFQEQWLAFTKESLKLPNSSECVEDLQAHQESLGRLDKLCQMMGLHETANPYKQPKLSGTPFEEYKNLTIDSAIARTTRYSLAENSGEGENSGEAENSGEGKNSGESDEGDE